MYSIQSMKTQAFYIHPRVAFFQPHTMEETEGKYTMDGATDISGKPAIKKNTGNWRACPYILGIITLFIYFSDSTVVCQVSSP